MSQIYCSSTRQPDFFAQHHLSSTMAGLTIIRGYHKQQEFQRRFNNDLNIHLSATAIFRYSNRWFTFRMDFLGLCTIVITAICAVAAKGVVSSAMAGLALANVFQTATFIPFVMRLKADFRARFNSVERVCEYANVSCTIDNSVIFLPSNYFRI